MNQLNVYILKCSDGSYYTGITNNIDRRMIEHQSGESPSSYTNSRRPVKLVWCSESMDANQAIDLEKQIKGWKRAKKEALIKGDWDEIVKLAAIRKGNKNSQSEGLEG